MVNITIDTGMVKMKFFQNILLVMICFVVLIGFGLSNNAFAQCKSNVSCSSPNDNDYLVCTTGEYDPCDNYVWWTFDFGRTSASGSASYLTMALRGTGIAYGCYAIDHDPNQSYSYNSIWWLNVGPSTSHELRVTRNGASGYWIDIGATATYRANDGI